MQSGGISRTPATVTDALAVGDGLDGAALYPAKKRHFKRDACPTPR
jgi:hypothetical protein